MFFGDEIHKIIDLIQEIWELAQSSTNFATRITNFKEYLQKDLENDESFTSTSWVHSMSKFQV